MRDDVSTPAPSVQKKLAPMHARAQPPARVHSHAHAPMPVYPGVHAYSTARALTAGMHVTGAVPTNGPGVSQSAMDSTSFTHSLQSAPGLHAKPPAAAAALFEPTDPFARAAELFAAHPHPHAFPVSNSCPDFSASFDLASAPPPASGSAAAGQPAQPAAAQAELEFNSTLAQRGMAQFAGAIPRMQPVQQRESVHGGSVSVAKGMMLPQVFVPASAADVATVSLPHPPPPPPHLQHPPQPPRPPPRPVSPAAPRSAQAARKAGPQSAAAAARPLKPGGGGGAAARNAVRKPTTGSKRTVRIPASNQFTSLKSPSASSPAVCAPSVSDAISAQIPSAVLPTCVPVKRMAPTKPLTPWKSPLTAKSLPMATPLAPAMPLSPVKAVEPVKPFISVKKPSSSKSLHSPSNSLRSTLSSMSIAPTGRPGSWSSGKTSGRTKGISFLLKREPVTATADNPASTGTSLTPEKDDDSNTTRWIVRYHDAWCRLTLSSFYKYMEERSLTPSQCARWLVDRTSISLTILEAATRTNELIMMDKSTVAQLSKLTRTCVSSSVNSSESSKPSDSKQVAIPLLRIAKENAEFLAQYTVLNGFDINSAYRFSYAARKLTDFLQTVTAPDAPIVVALTAIWGFMLSSWQAWALVKSRGRQIPPHFSPIADFLSRDDSLYQLIQTQMILDKMLSQATHNVSGTNSTHVEKAGHTFEQVITLASDVLDHALAIGSDSQVPLCVCGRKGHIPSQCTFKSHI